MNARKSMVLLVVMALAVWGCTTSSITAPSEDLLGAWAWVRSDGGIFPQVRTPASEGIERQVRVLASGIVQVHENGVLVVETTWETGVGAPGTQHEDEPVVRYGRPAVGVEEQAFSFPEADILVLDDGCCDAFVHTYRRIGP